MEDEELEALLELREQQNTRKQGPSDSFLVCECKCVSIGDIKEALTIGNIHTVDLDYLKEQLGLGSGCSSCLKDFKSWSSKIF
ncbi:MAG: (2Fe-2S)-binding protein [Bacteriovoracaceae bacterium]|nr:(2Fe-2S)-binding protein [Bacteriovoracaceae bacterium]